MESITIYQRVRPLRYAFTVKAGDTESALRAVSINSVLWGGIYNPIILIDDKGLTETVDLFDPDYLVNLSEISLADFKFSRFEGGIISKNEVFSDSRAAEGRRRLTLGLGIGLVFRKVNKNYQAQLLSESKARLLTSVPAQRQLSAAFSFGTYQSLPNGSNVRTAYQKMLNASETEFDEHDVGGLADYIFPIHLTSEGIKSYGPHVGLSTHVLYIGDPASLSDLTEFWNLRATGRVVWFVPVLDYASHRTAIISMIKGGNYRYGLALLANSITDVQKSSTIDDSVFEDACRWIRELKEGPFVSHNRPVEFSRSGSYRLEVSRLEAEESNEIALLHDDKLTPIKLLSPGYVDNENGLGDDKWVVELDLSNPFSSETTLLRLPRSPAMKDLLHHHFVSTEGVRVGESGLVKMQEGTNEHAYIHTVSAFDIISRLIEHDTGLKVSPSDPGRYADTIIRKMGGLQFGSRVFKVRGVREVLNRLSMGNYLTKGNIYDCVTSTAADRYGINWVDEFYRTLFIWQGRSAKEFDAVFDLLLEKRVIRPGLSFTCKNCNKEEWYHVTEFGEEFTCRFCFEKQRVRFASKGEWQYKADGVFQLANSAQGSLAVVVALWRLQHITSSHEGTYITNCNLGAREFEVDYCWLGMSSFSTAYELVLGEARNFNDYNEEDISKLDVLAEKFNERPYIAFATMKDSFSDAEKKLLHVVVEKGNRVIPLTRLDLDPYDVWDRLRDKKSPYIRQSRLAELSETLIKVNLQLGPRDKEAR